VRNVGPRDGEEVVQLYVRALDPKPGTPLRELRGFSRIFVRKGAQSVVRFELTPAEDLARFDDKTQAFVVRPGTYEIELGASSRDIRLRSRLEVN
jgi:beta-glucosidase